MRKSLSRFKKQIKFLFAFIKIRSYLCFSKNIDAPQNIQLLLEKQYDSLFVICPYGIGDILVGAMLANMIKRKKKLVFIIRDTYPSIDKVLKNMGVDECIANTYLTKEIEKYILSCRKFKGKNYIYGHFVKKIDHSIFYGYGISDHVWQDYCRFVYGVKKNSLYHISKTEDLDYKNPNRDVIISPYAHTHTTLSMKFWESLVSILLKYNYIVYTNVASNEREVTGSKRLNASLDAICDIANNSRAFIAMRSGICDLLAIKSSVSLYIINESEYLSHYWNLEYLREKGVYNFIIEKNLLQNIIDKLLIDQTTKSTKDVRCFE